MLEKIILCNRKGEIIESAKNGVYSNYNDLRDYEWGYETQLNKIVGFTKGVVEKTIPLIIFCDSEEQGIKIRNQIFSIMETDILEKQPGKIFIGDFYLSGYVTGSKKNKYLLNKRYMELQLTYTTDHPFWIKEHAYQFKSKELMSSNNKRYAYRYAYRYANGLMNTSIVNDHYTDCNFRMIVYGPIQDPLVYIGGHEYLVKIILEENEYLEIDSAAETVVKVTAFGERINAFHNRNFANSVFKPIRPGKQNVGWSGRFDFDLIVYEERSEPKWQ